MAPGVAQRFGSRAWNTSLHGYTTQASGSAPTTTRHPDAASTTSATTTRKTPRCRPNCKARARTGAVEHELLFGVETFRYRMDLGIALSARRHPHRRLSIPCTASSRPALGLNTSTLERQRNAAAYVQDAVKPAPEWRLVAGLRFDRFDQRLDNRRTGRTVAQQPTATLAAHRPQLVAGRPLDRVRERRPQLPAEHRRTRRAPPSIPRRASRPRRARSGRTPPARSPRASPCSRSASATC